MIDRPYLEHLTRDGERWDQIALAYYGDPHLYGPLVAANPEVAITPLLDGGVLLRVPVLDRAEAEPRTDPALLPPWKR
jgi:hypothetical protein